MQRLTTKAALTLGLPLIAGACMLAPASAQIDTRQKINPTVKIKKKPLLDRPLTLPDDETLREAYERGQMICRGRAQKWTLYPITSGSNAGKWQIHAWFEPKPAGQSQATNGQCAWYSDPGAFHTREYSETDGITLEYTFDFQGQPIERINFDNDGTGTVELDSRAIESDRTLRFLYNYVLNYPGDSSFVWVERTNRGNNGGFGRIYKVYNADREHGYQFPQTLY